MSTLDLRLDGEGAWPDLARKITAGKVIHLADDATIGLSALPGGMQSGRASVAWRFDLPSGRTVLAEMSLRTLHAAVSAIVARYGEPWMKSPLSEREHKLGLAIVDLTRQLTDAKQRLGEPLELNLETGDATWDRESQLRAALALAKSMVLCGESMSSEAATQIDDALAGRRPMT